MSHKSEIKNQNREKSKEGKYPFRFLLELRDVIKPIVIKRIQIIQAVSLTILIVAVGGVIWFNFFKAPSGDQLVDRMVLAAGGMDTWNKIDHGKFTRTHHLYSETGEQLSERIETFYFEKINGHVELMIEANRPGNDPVTIGKDDQGFWAVQNDVFIDAKNKAKELGMMCESQWCQPNCEMTMAFYRFSMPFKLKDDGVIAENGGKNKLLDKKYQVLNIGYTKEVGRDKWVFYADEKSNLITKMEYHHQTDAGNVLPEEFFWSDYKEIGGLMISQKWTRYWNNGKVLEEYSFADFDFDTELPGSFHKRPENLLSAK